MDIYLAAPIFTPEQLRVVEHLKGDAEGHGHKVFSPYHNSRNIFNGRKPRDCTPGERRMVLEDNIMNIDWCDCMLAWVGGMGGFTDPGVIWEMGYAHAKSKFTLAFLDDDMDADRPSMNLMLAGTVDAATRGWSQLNGALGMLPTDPKVSVRKHFKPELIFGGDMEPVV